MCNIYSFNFGIQQCNGHNISMNFVKLPTYNLQITILCFKSEILSNKIFTKKSSYKFDLNGFCISKINFKTLTLLSMINSYSMHSESKKTLKFYKIY